MNNRASTKIAEVIEASTTEFTAQCYELYTLPPLGSLVKTGEIYAVVCHAATSSIEPGRKPIARGKDEAAEEDIYRSSPQLTRLLRSEFTALVVGHRGDDQLHRYLPPTPARIHSFVYTCTPAEIREFSQSLDFLNLLVNPRLPIPVDELIAAALRQMKAAQAEPDAFLVTAGKTLAALLSGDFPLLKSILGRLK